MVAAVFDVTILGVNSAVPVHGRHPSCHIVRYDSNLLMIDCGEGSQSQLSRYKIKRSKISTVLISHLHGDHVYGLPGFLTTSSLQGRTTPLTIHGPAGISELVETMTRLSGAQISYPLEVIEYDATATNTIEVDARLTVTTVPLQHRIPTMGYVIAESKPEINIDSAAIAKYELTVPEIKLVKAGQDLVRSELHVPNAELTIPQNGPRSYAYVSDTLYDSELAASLQGVTTLYHETTYLDDLQAIAAERYHSTLSQAVSMAQVIGARQLITGHYSSRYRDISVFLTEGRKLWSGVELGEEGRTYSI